MSNRRYYPCKICGKKIDLKTFKDDDVMWNHDDDEIAHTKCLPENYNVDLWISTEETRDACLPLDDI